MSGVRRTSLFVLSANNFAKAALASIGLQKKTHGCMSHAFQVRPLFLNSLINEGS